MTVDPDTDTQSEEQPRNRSNEIENAKLEHSGTENDYSSKWQRESSELASKLRDSLGSPKSQKATIMPERFLNFRSWRKLKCWIRIVC